MCSLHATFTAELFWGRLKGWQWWLQYSLSSPGGLPHPPVVQPGHFLTSSEGTTKELKCCSAISATSTASNAWHYLTCIEWLTTRSITERNATSHCGTCNNAVMAVPELQYQLLGRTKERTSLILILSNLRMDAEGSFLFLYFIGLFILFLSSVKQRNA